MKRNLDYRWRLREVMAAHGLWKTSDLAPLLAERGVTLSPAQIYRLVAQTPNGSRCRRWLRCATSCPALLTT
jgi:hypothetical protein